MMEAGRHQLQLSLSTIPRHGLVSSPHTCTSSKNAQRHKWKALVTRSQTSTLFEPTMASLKPIPVLKAVGQDTIKQAMLSHMQQINGVKSFNIRMGKEYHYSLTSWLHMQDRVKPLPLRDHFEDKWMSRTDPLWWSAISPLSVAKNRTIRSHHSRRLRHAFTKALEAKGYDKEGNSILGGRDPLRGTVQLTATATLLRTKMSDLLGDMDKAVAHLIHFQDYTPKAKKPFAKKKNPKVPRRRQKLD